MAPHQHKLLATLPFLAVKTCWYIAIACMHSLPAIIRCTLQHFHICLQLLGGIISLRTSPGRWSYSHVHAISVYIVPPGSHDCSHLCTPEYKAVWDFLGQHKNIMYLHLHGLGHICLHAILHACTVLAAPSDYMPSTYIPDSVLRSHHIAYTDLCTPPWGHLTCPNEAAPRAILGALLRTTISMQRCRCSLLLTLLQTELQTTTPFQTDTTGPSSASAGHKCMLACKPCLCLESRLCLDPDCSAPSTHHLHRGRLYLLSFRYPSTYLTHMPSSIHL